MKKNNKFIYVKLLVSKDFPLKKNDILKMSGHPGQYKIVKPLCKNNWLRRLLGKPDITGYTKLKRYA